MWVKRAGIVFVVTVLLMITLVFRIFYISAGFMNQEIKISAGGRSKTITLFNTKGLIYDRNLNVLSGNKTAYYLAVNPREFDRKYIDYLCGISAISSEELLKKINSESVFVLQSNTEVDDIPGVYVFNGIGRYDENTSLIHLLGYLDADRVVGLSGVEKAFNKELSVFESNVKLTYSSNALQGAIDGGGMLANGLDNYSESGVVLSLDKQLSDAAFNIMSNYISKGALVIMDANNGEILTSISLPTYNPMSISDYFDSNNGELVNRAVSNQSVGSVFKIIMAVSSHLNGLQDFMYECKGGINIGGRVFGCQNNKNHGIQNLDEAFSNSCNSYFIALGQLLGYDAIIETAQLFGIDSNIKLCKDMYSASGKLPSQSGTQALANLSIGQGELLLSPLCVARITAAVCNGGFLVNPTIYQSMYLNGGICFKSDYKFKSQIISSNIAQQIKDMCVKCVEIGTGKNAKPLGNAGGKTASAQTGIFNSEGKEKLSTYFTGFYPAENPQYVITVFAEDGKSGSETCAPVFREICNYIFENY